MATWKEMRTWLEEEADATDGSRSVGAAIRACLARLDAAERALYDDSDESHSAYSELCREQEKP